MPVYRLEIECADTLWITAHDDRGAIELASAHIADSTLDDDALVQLKRDADDALNLHVPRQPSGRPPRGRKRSR